MKKLLIAFVLLVGINAGSFAQSRLGLFIGGGVTWYYGDMNDRLLTHPKLFDSYFNGGLLYRLSPHFDIVANYINGEIVGADSLAIQEFNIKRDLHFQSKIWEVSLRADYKPFIRQTGKKIRLFTPYVFAGIGYFHHNPQAVKNGQLIDLQPLGTEGQYIDGGNYPKPYKLYQLSVPLGIGIETKLSRAFSIRFEISNHFTFTDYLDDVSGDYADSAKLSMTPNGALAVDMASNLNRNYPDEGFGRGNPKNNDTYMTVGFSILYTPVYEGKGGGGSGSNRNAHGGKGKKKKKKSNCPAFD